ncbi:reverse transcriptase domain-containing protein [Tanacetum coccineum]
MFFGNKNEDPHEHISNIADIVDLFHSPGVSKDQVMLMAFPFTLKGRSRQWMKRLFVFQVDFVVLDMKKDHKIPIILGRPFLATANAMIDVFNKKISFEVGNETITFDLEKSMRFPPSDDDTYHSTDIIDLSILEHISGDLEPEYEDYTKPTLFAATMFEGEKPTTKLKDLPSHLEYAFLNNNQEFPVIISSLLSSQEKELLLGVLTKHKSALAWRKLNDATRKDHFPLPFIDQMLERLSGNEYYCFLDGFSGYFQIPLAPEDQEKPPHVVLIGHLAIGEMPLRLCNAPAIFQRFITTIFHDMCKDFMEVFMDDFFVFGNSFDSCLNNLSKMLARCEESNLVLNWEKCHFMVKEGIVLGHKISKAGIEEFTIEIMDKKGMENLAADHLSRLENPELEELDEDAIRDSLPDEHLMVINIKEVRNKGLWIARILKTLVLMVLSIIHSIFNPSHAYIWESDILDLID